MKQGRQRTERGIVRRCCCALLLAVLPFAAPAALALDAEEELALKVKAALLFNIVKFVDWPPQKLARADTPIRLCVLEFAPDPLTAVLEDTVRGKSVDGHPLVIYRSSRAAELRDCHLVYTNETDGLRLRGALSMLEGTSALVVHEHEEALRDGAIRLLVVDRRLRFEVNTAATARENLQLSSKLLSLAQVVQR